MSRAAARSPRVTGRTPGQTAKPPPATGASPAVVAGCVIAALVFLIGFARLWSYVLDDTYISLRYAQHLAAGQGLVYNPGERVEGYSNFLWTVLLAVPFVLGLPPVPYLKVVVVLAALATAWATARLARSSGLVPLESGNRWLAWLPGWLILLTPLVIERSADGMETLPFALLLVLAACWAFETPHSGRFPRLGLTLAALAMMRPDGVLAAPVLLAIAASRGAPPRQLAVDAACFAFVLALFLLGRHAYYGEWLPNTYFAKRGGGMVWGIGWRSVLDFLAQHGGWAWLIAVPALVARPTRAAAWAVLAVAATRIVFHAWAGGEWIGFRRFLVPALPFMYLLVVAGAMRVPWPSMRPVAAAVAALLLVGPSWLQAPKRQDELLAYARGLDAAQGALGRAIAARTGPEALIAMDDAGLGPFLSGRRCLDMLGLNDRHIARLPGRFSFKYDITYVLGRSPDLIVLVSTAAEPTRGEQFPLPGHAALASDPAFHAWYQFRRIYTMRDDYHLGVFRRRDSRAVPADF